MAKSNEIPESEELYNQEIEAIIEEIKEIYNDPLTNELEKNRRMIELLKEMEEYTQPLIQQIDNLSVNQKDIILYKISRLFPEIIQKEIKSISLLNEYTQRQQTANHELIQTTILHFESSEDKTNEISNSTEDLNKILNHLGYKNIKQLLLNHTPSTIYDLESGFIQRQQSERTTSNNIEKQLNEWKKQKEEKQIEAMEKIKQEQDDNKSKPNKNNAKKVMMMMGVENFENADDVTAICNASTKALRKLV